jgi:hypothetical protein
MIKISKALQSVMIVSKSGEFRETPLVDNPEPSPVKGRCNDYLEREYTRMSGSARHLN